MLCLQYNYRNRGSLTFDPLTLVPIQVKLMKTELLTQKEVKFRRWRETVMMSSVPQYPSCFVLGSHGQRVAVEVFPVSTRGAAAQSQASCTA